MTGKDLERMLELLLPHTAAHLDHVGRALRAAGLLPIGGRGISAPHLTAQQVANMLIACATAQRPTDAPQMVATYAALPASWTGNTRTGEPSAARAFAGAGTFGEALAAILESPALADAVDEVLIFQSWPRAMVRCDDATLSGFYGFASHEDAKAAGYRTTPSGPIFHYSAGTLAELSEEFTGMGAKAWSNR